MIYCAVLAVLFLLSFGTARGQTSQDGELSTTNRAQIQRFWSAMDASNGPVTLLAFGDSVADSYRSVQEFVFGDLATRFGTAGYTVGNVDNATLWILGGGASFSSPTTNWWAEHALLPPGSSILWTNQNSQTGSLLCDQVGVFWVAQPDGGQFTLSVSTNGGSWSAPLLALDGFSPTAIGRFASLALSEQQYRFQIEGVSGTNVIIGPQYLLRGSTGINLAFVSQDGINLDQVFAVSTNVLYPILQAIAPHLIIWHMKELADIGETALSNRLYDLEALMRTSGSDVVYLGTPYDVHDLTSDFTPVQNRLVRQAAVRDNRAYVDCMTPCISYQWMTNNGFLDDTIHPSNIANRFLADLVERELGLFALRTDRRLSLSVAGGVAHLRWLTTSNLTYAVEGSRDLLHWTNMITVIGDGEFYTFTNSSGGDPAVFFRLSITP